MYQLTKITGGFTLLEVLIYCALLSLIITLSVGASESLFEGTARLKDLQGREREARFVMDKISFILKNVKAEDILIGTSVSVRKENEFFCLSYNTSVQNIFLSSGANDCSDEPQALVSSSIAVFAFSALSEAYEGKTVVHISFDLEGEEYKSSYYLL